MKRLIFLTLCLLTFIEARSANNFSDSLYMRMYEFRKQIKALDGLDLDMKNLRHEIAIIELVTGKNTPDFGLYSFFLNRVDHSAVSFMVFDKGTYELYGIKLYNMVIEKILNSNIDCDLKKQFIMAIIKIVNDRDDYIVVETAKSSNIKAFVAY